MDPPAGGERRDADADEWAAVARLRTSVEHLDPAAKEVDDFALRRFLRARDLDVDKAAAMVVKFLAWRRAAMPAGGRIGAEEVKNEVAQGKLFLQGADMAGRPIAVVFAARHFPDKRDLAEFQRFVAYSLDKITDKMPSGEEKFVAIADLQGWSYANCDIRAYLAALDILQNYYPERLAKAFLIHVPKVFMMAWRIVYPFIDAKTKKKFVFVEDKKLKATLEKEIAASQLPEIYGGALPLTAIDQE